MAPLSLTSRLLQRVVRLSCVRPALTVFVAFALAVLGVGYRERISDRRKG